MSQVCAARSVLVASMLACACNANAVEPVVLLEGEWIDVVGIDRSTANTCVGTLAYVDAYAGALATEFGVDDPIGSYQWFSSEQDEKQQPCGDAFACTEAGGTMYSTIMPHEHEMVHLANFASYPCPKPLAEGLAEYHSPWGNDASVADVELLVARLEHPDEQPPDAEYGILGRFAGYLVARFGLPRVLQVCAATGRAPSGPQLSQAFATELGATTEQLLADFQLEPESCYLAARYQSRVFACGVAGMAADVGLVGDGTSVEVTVDFGCGRDGTVGPLGDLIWTVRRFDVEADASYLVWIRGEGIEDVEVTLASCAPCGTTRTFEGQVIGPEQLVAGRYSLELRAPSQFDGRVTFSLEKVP